MRPVPNYQLPIAEALAVLEDSAVDRFPVDLHAIQRQFFRLFQIRSYGSFMKTHCTSREECFRYLGSEDGAAVSDGHGRYVVYYNEEKWKQRTRFTIAHEIGHIFLNHHQEHGISILTAKGVGQDLYGRLEKEADCFARNLLCPAYHAKKLLDSHGFTRESNGKDGWARTKETRITENLETIFYAEDLVETAFNVSTAAAKARVDFLKADMNKYASYQMDWEPTSHIKHTAAWYCSTCGLERFPGSSYCSECGKKLFVFQVSAAGFQYREAGMNANKQFSLCPVCGNKEFSQDAGFCKICGTPLSNACTHDATHLNHPEARHCHACGKPTAFKETDYHFRVKQSLIHTIEGDPSMIYKSDIQYDPKTNRVNECPRCQNEIISKGSQYCRICGLELVNKCIPEPWYDSFGHPTDADTHENPPDARFCEQCGAPTVYYQKHKFLKSYGGPEREFSVENAHEDDGDVPF